MLAGFTIGKLVLIRLSQHKTRYPDPALERGMRDAARLRSLDAAVDFAADFPRRCRALALPAAHEPQVAAAIARFGTPGHGHSGNGGGGGGNVDDDEDAAAKAAKAAAKRRAAEILPMALDRNAKVGPGMCLCVVCLCECQVGDRRHSHACLACNWQGLAGTCVSVCSWVFV